MSSYMDTVWPQKMFNLPLIITGRSAVFIFTLKPEIAEALKDMTTASPAVKLLAQYFR
jgi:hypothetical protein